MKQGEGKLVLEVSCFLLWLLKPDGSIRDLIMSEFSKGVVLETEQLYRGNRKYFDLNLRSAAISSTPRAAAFATVFIEGRRHRTEGLSASHALISIPAFVRIASNAREEMR
jgi:hypothetical protein